MKSQVLTLIFRKVTHIGCASRLMGQKQVQIGPKIVDFYHDYSEVGGTHHRMGVSAEWATEYPTRSEYPTRLMFKSN